MGWLELLDVSRHKRSLLNPSGAGCVNGGWAGQLFWPLGVSAVNKTRCVKTKEPADGFVSIESPYVTYHQQASKKPKSIAQHTVGITQYLP